MSKSSRRHGGPHGVLAFFKPPGLSSHDAVSWARRTFGTRRVGHTGTLDPAACGLLPLCVGAATRLSDPLMAARKEYVAEALWGLETDSGDLLGAVTQRSGDPVTRDDLQAVLSKFRGTIRQRPPLHSAIKVDGRPLYEAARAGDRVEVPERQVTVHALELLEFWPSEDAASGARALLRIECSSGTYIRSLVRDLGRELGVPAVMSFLVRTRAGGFTSDDAVPAELLAERGASACLIPLSKVMERLATATVIDDAACALLRQGRPCALDTNATGPVAVGHSNGLLWVWALPTDQGLWRPDKVLDLASTT